MEHELFQSELKPSVDDSLLSKIIRGSSSGENSHRAAVMGLIFERSVQERRERMATRLRDSLRPGPMPEPKRSNEWLNNSIRPAEPPAPAPAPQPVLRPPPQPQSTPREAAQNQKSVPRPEPTHRMNLAEMLSQEGVHRKSVPDVRTSDSKPTKDTFLRCPVRSCGASLGRYHLKDGLHCGVCGNRAMLCANCGVCRSTNVKNCSGCGLRFVG